jgi:hypothetical protein
MHKKHKHILDNFYYKSIKKHKRIKSLQIKSIEKHSKAERIKMIESIF